MLFENRSPKPWQSEVTKKKNTKAETPIDSFSPTNVGMPQLASLVFSWNITSKIRIFSWQASGARKWFVRYSSIDSILQNNWLHALYFYTFSKRTCVEPTLQIKIIWHKLASVCLNKGLSHPPRCFHFWLDLFPARSEVGHLGMEKYVQSHTLLSLRRACGFTKSVCVSFLPLRKLFVITRFAMQVPGFWVMPNQWSLWNTTTKKSEKLLNGCVL